MFFVLFFAFLSDSSFIIALSVRFVKNFFELFSSFFVLGFARRSLSFLKVSLAIIALFFPSVKSFSELFSSSFSLSFRRRPFSEQPCHYSTLSFACQVILKTFFKLLNFLCDFEGSLSPSLECLTIIPLFLTPVNPFSDIFSLFFSFSFLNYI